LRDIGDDRADSVQQSTLVGVGRCGREQNARGYKAGADDPAEQKKPQSIDVTVLFDGIHVNHPLG
jgi:hypothetical protein